MKLNPATLIPNRDVVACISGALGAIAGAALGLMEACRECAQYPAGSTPDTPEQAAALAIVGMIAGAPAGFLLVVIVYEIIGDWRARRNNPATDCDKPQPGICT